jgi:hypothetical protein
MKVWSSQKSILKKWKKYGILFLLCLIPWFGCSQIPDLDIQRNVKKLELPFRYENNFIVVDVLFNGFLPLHFLFDTGAEHTILTKREISDLMQIDYQRRFTVIGADLETELTAYLARGIALRIKAFRAINRSILVLDEDYFRFEEFAGVNIHGIFGADIFRRFVVKVDYDRKVITLYDPGHFQRPAGYMELQLEINRGKPYVKANALFGDSTNADLKLLLDTGANLPLLLHTNTHPNLNLPEEVIRSQFGRGLGGELRGFVGRLQELQLQGYTFNNVVTTFQDISPELDSAYLNNRNGLVGNPMLSRFSLIIDYIREKCYIKPNRDFDEDFRFDRSGLLLAASGIHLDDYIVYGVVPGSPAEEAGIQVGDEIVKVNWWPVGFYSLQGLTRKLQGRVGKKIRLKIKRKDEKFKVRFRLRDLI